MRETLDKDLDEAIDRNDRGIVEVSSKLDRYLDTETAVLISLAAAIIIGCLLLGLAITVLTITRPLKQLTGSLDLLGKGDTRAEIFGLTRKDELGAIARSTHNLVGILLNAARSESGLRNVTANVMVADTGNNIVYCNKAVLDTLKNAQSDIPQGAAAIRCRQADRPEYRHLPQEPRASAAYAGSTDRHASGPHQGGRTQPST
jgi:HAMP domain-containing protein